MSENAPRIITALAIVHQRLVDLAAQFRAQPQVSSVTVGMTPRRYESGDRVECYVDAELTNGNSVAAWLEFMFDDGSWVVESSILHDTDAGQDALLELATRYAVDDDLVAELDGASAALIAAATRLDLKGL